jgi:hypothetical protein
MNETTGSDTPDVYGALWIGALLLASGAIQDPFSAELEEWPDTSSVSTDHEGVASAPPRRRL